MPHYPVFAPGLPERAMQPFIKDNGPQSRPVVQQAGETYTTAPPFSSLTLTGLIRSSRFTPSHMARAAATNTDE